MSVAVLFPGQGEQRAGMFCSLPQGSADFISLASAVLDEDASALDSAASLSGTRGAQLALLIAGSAWARAADQAGVRADYFAGHSVGLWTAAVASGAVDFADAVRLVDIRARRMALASPPDSGMIAIEGLSASAVAAVAEALRGEGRQIWLSNVNSPVQVTASGIITDLDVLTERLRAVGARRITRLAVSVPAHTPLMQPAADAVGSALGRMRVRTPSVPIAGNVTGQTLFSATQLRTDLVESISRGVKWSTAIAILAERGVDAWVQLPPGRTLLSLTPTGDLALEAATIGIEETERRLAARRRASR
jgi:malonate decarboxylase epsilon subunit